MAKARNFGTPLVSWKQAVPAMCSVVMLLSTSPHQICSAVLGTVCFAGSGLCGAEMCIDCTVADGPCCPAHVVTYAEAKFTLMSTSDQAEAVGQLWVSLMSYVFLCSPTVTLCCSATAYASHHRHNSLVLIQQTCLRVHSSSLLFIEHDVARISDVAQMADINFTGNTSYVCPFC